MKCASGVCSCSQLQPYRSAGAFGHMRCMSMERYIVQQHVRAAICFGSCTFGEKQRDTRGDMNLMFVLTHQQHPGMQDLM